MKVRAGGVAAAARERNDLSAPDFLARDDHQLRKVSVISVQPVPMVDHYQLAVTAAPSSAHHHAIAANTHWRSARSLEIYSGMESALAGKRIRPSPERASQDAYDGPQARLVMSLPAISVMVIDARERC